jgi:hypothetical protein
VSDVSRAVEQIARIHDQLAKTEVYRGWRSAPVAASGLVGLGAAAWQVRSGTPVDARQFLAYWLVVASLAFLTACAEIVWRYPRAAEADRRRARRVIGQFLPALGTGALVSVVIVRLDAALVTLLPALWALLFGVGIVAALPYVTVGSLWIAGYYGVLGVALLWSAGSGSTPSPWAVGGTFGAGQLLAAGVLYWSLERGTRGS